MQSLTGSGARPPQDPGIENTFGELLYRLRLRAGLSRMELADRVLCSENYIYRLESRNPRHRRVPSPWLVHAFSEALQLNGDQRAALLEARDRLEIETADQPRTIAALER